MADMMEVPEGGDNQSIASSSRCDVRETRLRLPRKVIQELKQMADSTDKTMNALIAGYIDAGLKADGRPGIHERAPWFKEYLRRKGGPGSRAYHPHDDDEEFT